jgi:glycolate oxidase
MQEAAGVAEVLEAEGAMTIHFADSEDQKNRLWKMRRSVAEAVKAHSIYKEEDTVVMRANLPELLSGVKEIGRRYGFQSVCYGHAGDGNLHVNILKGDLSDFCWNHEIPDAIREIFRLCKKLGGTLSGEHGVGWVQKDYLTEVQTKTQILLQRQIKATFDPKNILNPGKIFPESFS